MEGPRSDWARYAFGYSDKKPGKWFWIIHGALLAFALSSMFSITYGKTIHRDGGGFIVEYAKEANRLARTGEPVIIDGICNSACTIYLGLPNTCVTPRSRLGFHSGKGGPKRVIEYANKLIMEMYPPKVRAWVRSKGGLTSKLIVLQGKELLERVRVCK